MTDEQIKIPDLSRFENVSSTRVDETPTDTGNAYRFARLVGGKCRYSVGEGTWLIWDQTRLRRDDESLVMHLTLDVCRDIREYAHHVNDEKARVLWMNWARQTESVGHRKAMLELAKTLPDLIIPAEELDSKSHLLNLPNGTYNFQTHKLQPHNIADHISRCCKVPYNPELLWTPLLGEYVATFMPEPGHWDYLMKILGSILWGGNSFRIWPIIHGPTTTGKTQLVGTIASILGDYSTSVNTSVFRANQDDKPRPDLLDALGARFVYAEEGSDQWEIHGDHIQLITGQGPIKARGIHSGVMVERIPEFTPIIVCNTMAQVKDAGPPLKRRLKTLNFTHSVVGMENIRKRDLFMQDEETKTALLNQLIMGCHRAYDDDILDIPSEWAEATMATFDDMNSVGQFIKYAKAENLLVEYDAEVPLTSCWKASDFYSFYRMWIENYGDHNEKRSMPSLRKFGEQLRGLGWDSKLSAGTRWIGKVDGRNTNFIGGN